MKRLPWIALLLIMALAVTACAAATREPNATDRDTNVEQTLDDASSTEPNAEQTDSESPTEEMTEVPTETPTEAPTEVPTEAPLDPAVQNAWLISPEEFLDPSNEYRALHIEHGYPSGSVSNRVNELMNYGFGGVATTICSRPTTSAVRNLWRNSMSSCRRFTRRGCGCGSTMSTATPAARRATLPARVIPNTRLCA